ncbi:TraR/DksA family transcriptional regulator [Rariglobus hedericola]|uniref:TraR/DksA family transcriptional regulator n=1 Tax=Rariglobus hedericola TaxID=2597822 RepID=UPI001396C7BA|nr:TraR/DksA C4-type zinc finger protein [Rariglobus hedericola]
MKKSPPKPVKASKISPKKAPAKKPIAAKAVTKKPAILKKPVAKPVTKSKSSPAAKPAPKSVAPVKSDKSKAPAPSSSKVEKTPVKPAAAAPKAAVSAKSSARDSLRSRILEKSKAKEKVRPIAFSLDEIREIAKTAKVEVDTKSVAAKTTTKTTKLITASTVIAKPAQPHHIKAASLADILGFNPKKKQVPHDDSLDIPEKFLRYYKLLIELRNHLTGQIDTHSEETLKRSSKDDSGDLSSYGQHMADAGTDTFDRDFALSLVSSEQEALSEVESAIKRIKDGSYGICENTQKPIAKERLLAVPFTRYSAEAQKDIERNRMRSRSQAGLFGELGEEGGTLSAGSSGDGDDE